MITETKLTKKFITDEEETDLLLDKNVGQEVSGDERGRFYVLFADIEAHGHMGSGPGCALLTSYGEATKPRKDEFRKQVGKVSGEPWREKTGWKRTRTESLRQSESERGEELELREMQVMCLMNLGTKMMCRWRFDMRTHLAVTSKRTSTKRK